MMMAKMKLSFGAYRKLMSLKPYLESVDDVSQLFFYAREGNIVEKIIAGVGVAGEVLNNISPVYFGSDVFTSHGFEHVPCVFGDIVYAALLNSKYKIEKIPTRDSSDYNTILWPDLGVGVLCQERRYEEGLYFAPEADRERFWGIIREELWGDLTGMTVAGVPDTNSHREQRLFRLSPMPAAGEYQARIKPEWYANRLRKYGAGTRTMLLRGPSGGGKSVLAQHIARELDPGARLLKISSAVLKEVNGAGLAEFIQAIKPTLVLLDDLNLAESTELYLALLEGLRVTDTYIVVTMMTDGIDVTKEDSNAGAWSFPGMRPGRIDEIHTIYPPDVIERHMILNHYLLPEYKNKLPEEVYEKTEGLTGAYLMELARRINVHGLDSYSYELSSIIKCAPSFGKGDG